MNSILIIVPNTNLTTRYNYSVVIHLESWNRDEIQGYVET